MAVLAYAPLGYRLFGRMDGEWLETVYLMSPYLFPTQWGRGEWIEVVLAQAVVTIAAIAAWRNDRRRGSFLAAVALVGAAAVAATLAASVMGYRLLLQGQPYRFLWLVRLMPAPLTVYLAAHLYRKGDEPHRLLAVGLVSTLTLSVYAAPELLFVVLCLLVLAILLRGGKRGFALGREGDTPAELAWSVSPGALHSQPGPGGDHSPHVARGTAATCTLPLAADAPSVPESKPAWSFLLAISLAAGLLGGAVYREIVIARILPTLSGKLTSMEAYRMVIVSFGPAVWLLVTVVVVTALRRWLGLRPGPAWSWPFLSCFCSLLPFAFTQTAFYRQQRGQRWADLQFVADFLNQARPAGNRPLCLYWSNGEFDTIWLELHACSYFAQHHQVQGAVFNRQTALEGRRRAGFVARFESRFMLAHQEFMHPHWLANMTALFHVDPRDAVPSTSDLTALCHEDTIDYAILPDDFGAWRRRPTAMFLSTIVSVFANCWPARNRFFLPDSAAPRETAEKVGGS